MNVEPRRVSHAWPISLFACPRCCGALTEVGDGTLYCHADDLSFRKEDGIWRMLTPAAADRYDQFISDYEEIRDREGRGSMDTAFYRSLPFEDLSGRFQGDWKIRARSYRHFEKHILDPMAERKRQPLRILDLGAGNCWLANRLAGKGNAVAAIDLLENTADGLGAHVHYANHFTPIQASIEALPIADSCVDLAIFNASLHYAESLSDVLGEALRSLAPEGRLVIMDTPVYRDGTSGQQMMIEQRAYFQRRFGIPADSLNSTGFLTFDALTELAADLNLEWRRHTPFYGLRWALKPWLASVRGTREPAKFLVLEGQRTRKKELAG